MMTVTIKGVAYKCVTIGEFARMCNRTAVAFRRMETRGDLPPANFRLPGPLIRTGEHAGTNRQGAKIYTIDLVEKVKVVLKEHLKQGVKLPDDARSKIFALFREERELVLNPKTS